MKFLGLLITLLAVIGQMSFRPMETLARSIYKKNRKVEIRAQMLNDGMVIRVNKNTAGLKWIDKNEFEWQDVMYDLVGEEKDCWLVIDDIQEKYFEKKSETNELSDVGKIQSAPDFVGVFNQALFFYIENWKTVYFTEHIGKTNSNLSYILIPPELYIIPTFI